MFKLNLLTGLITLLVACHVKPAETHIYSRRTSNILNPVPAIEYDHLESPFDGEGIVDIAYVPNNPDLIFTLSEGKISLFDLKASQFLWDFWSPTSLTGDSIFDGPLRLTQYGNIAISPDGRAVAIGSLEGRIALTSTLTGKTLRKKTYDLRAPDHPPQTMTNEISSIQFSHDGRFVFAASPIHGDVLVLDAQTLELEANLTGADEELTEIGMSPDGRYVYGGGYGGIHIWELSSKKYLRRFGNPARLFRKLSFSPDFSYVLSTSGELIELYDVQLGDVIQTFKGHTNLVSDVAFMPDFSQMISVSGDNEGDQSIRVWDIATGRELQKISIENYPQFITKSVRVSPDKQTVAVATIDRLLIYKIVP